MENAKRVFVAIPISENTQKEILKWEENFQNLPVRWLKGKNLHITLLPPWYEGNRERIQEALQSTRRNIEPFDILFQKVTFGPNPREPRLVWAEGGTPEELLELKANIERALNTKPESRPFKTHLTLARFRPEQFQRFKIKNLNECVQWKETITSFVLMESILEKTGAEYEILSQFEF